MVGKSILVEKQKKTFKAHYYKIEMITWLTTCSILCKRALAMMQRQVLQSNLCVIHALSVVNFSFEPRDVSP